MKTKRIPALLLAVSLVLALAACHGDSPRNSMEDSKDMGGMASMEDAGKMDSMDSMESAKDMDKMDAMDGKESMAETGGMTSFPAFEGMDLEGNTVKSEELFGGNAATVVNFWFTTCGPCVGELAELDALNQELSQKGAALIGINAFTLGGDETAIADAKEVLDKKGANYQNVYFDEDSAAGTFAAGVYAFPTTYVVDREGAIVGEPIVGALTEPKQREAVRKLVDQALAMDKEQMG